MNRPKVLLLDEPLGALDLKLREEMQVELKAIQRQVGITFVFVTHDQEEALTMSDRIAVFNAGRIEQVGTPGRGLRAPATAFVAGFVGTSNLLEPPRRRRSWAGTAAGPSGPEKIRMAVEGVPSAPTSTRPPAPSREVVYAGPATRFLVDLEAGARLVGAAAEPADPSMDVVATAVPGAAGLAARARVPTRLGVTRAVRPTVVRTTTHDEEEQMATSRRMTFAAVGAVAALVLAGAAARRQRHGVHEDRAQPPDLGAAEPRRR